MSKRAEGLFNPDLEDPLAPDEPILTKEQLLMI